MSRQFEKHRVQKKYVALVTGNVEYDEGIIDASMGRHPKHFDKKAVRWDVSSKQAITLYRVIRRFGKKGCLVALHPKTGRTHQLRVHMAYLGHPILGDDKYGKKNSFKRLALHAQGLGFKHPAKDRFVEFQTMIPEEFLKM